MMTLNWNSQLIIQIQIKAEFMMNEIQVSYVWHTKKLQVC